MQQVQAGGAKERTRQGIATSAADHDELCIHHMLHEGLAGTIGLDEECHRDVRIQLGPRVEHVQEALPPEALQSIPVDTVWGDGVHRWAKRRPCVHGVEPQPESVRELEGGPECFRPGVCSQSTPSTTGWSVGTALLPRHAITGQAECAETASVVDPIINAAAGVTSSDPRTTNRA